MRFIVLSLACGVFAVSTADADNCRVQQRVVVRQHVVHHAVAAIVTPIPVATYVPFAVQVPTYSVGVAPQQLQQQSQTDAVALAIEKLALAVERIGGGQPQTLQSQQMPSHVQVMTARCASCHDKGVAKSKGGDFTLLDGGKEVQLTGKQIVRVLAKTHDGTMPKTGPKLNDAEKKAISQWIESSTQ